MGQVLSNIIICICGETFAEDEVEWPRPNETSPLPVSPASQATPALPSDPSTNVELLLTLLSSSTSGSCNESISSYVSNPPPGEDLVGDQTAASDDVFHQYLLISPPDSGLDSQGDSCTAGAFQQDLLNRSSSSESSSDDPNSDADGELQRNLLISLPWFEYLVIRDSSIDAVEEKKQVVSSQVLNLKEARERAEEIIEEEEEVQEKVSKAVINERWIKQYSSCQKILLVGEGDFSFSASLALAFGSAHNIIATSLDSTGFLSSNYRSSMSNIQILRSRGAKVMHGVDATEMANSFFFQAITFDRIVFNFPLAGFFPDESRESQLRRQRKLVRLFMANAKKMLGRRGEIHVTHKSNGFFLDWNLEQLAASEGLMFLEKVHFNFTDFPGYRTKYGFGGDKNFNCNPSKTYKFGLL